MNSGECQDCLVGYDTLCSYQSRQEGVLAVNSPDSHLFFSQLTLKIIERWLHVSQ